MDSEQGTKYVVICTTSYESHTFFHEFAELSK
jgi:hypothetical protein